MEGGAASDPMPPPQSSGSQGGAADHRDAVGEDHRDAVAAKCVSRPALHNVLRDSEGIHKTEQECNCCRQVTYFINDYLFLKHHSKEPRVWD
uniref:Uncharacterized protein n=1 Tax=Knipowitschia caucasica TaxID=637954 RepID=A0AAV2J8D7_KNICA